MCTPGTVEVVEVIFVSTARGDGSPGNPSRGVYQYWSKDGRLLAESDGLFEDPEQASCYAAERLLQMQGLVPKDGVGVDIEGGRLPWVYIDAELRNVTPIDCDRDRIGLGFDVGDGGPIRLALSREAASALVALLNRHLFAQGAAYA